MSTDFEPVIDELWSAFEEPPKTPLPPARPARPVTDVKSLNAESMQGMATPEALLG